VANALGIAYLWVDSFCIIQDSEVDKASELVRMGQIYRDAYLTIIASCAPSAIAGFLQGRVLPPAYDTHPTLPFDCRSGEMGTVSVFLEPGRDLTMDDPVNSRAWCLQELLLSPRKLIYASDTAKYECQSMTMCLGDAVSDRRVGDQLLDALLFPQPALDKQLASWSLSDWERLREEWELVVANYTQRRLTYATDKLPAFGGVAELFHRAWAERAGRYIAGLWEKALPWDLLWTCQSRWGPDQRPKNDRPARRPTEYVAPSWSWMSVNGPITAGSEPFNRKEGSIVDCEVLGVDVQLYDPRALFGRVVSASLTLQLVRIRTQWIDLPASGADKDVAATFLVPKVKLAEEEAQTPSEGRHEHRSATLFLPKGGLRSGELTDSGNEDGADGKRGTLFCSGEVFMDSTERIAEPREVWAIFIQLEREGRYEARYAYGEGLLVAATDNDEHRGKFRRVGQWSCQVSVDPVNEPQPNERHFPSEIAWFDNAPTLLGGDLTVMELV
jgi:hypothetical protein